MDYGIDISHWETITDAGAVRGNGITFAYVKATEGVTITDQSFSGSVDELRGAGIVVGGYHFARPGDARAQARYFLAALDSKGLASAGNLRPALDMEDAALAGSADQFVRDFTDELGMPVMVYGNLDWWTHDLHPDTWAPRDVLGWIARYNGDPGQPGWTYPRLALHQHSDAGTVPGIPGAVDRDATVGSYTLANLVLGGVPAAPTSPPPTAPPASPPAAPSGDTWVVKSGDTLSAIARAWGVSVAAIAAANGIANPNLIRIGQVIHRPGAAASAPETYVVHSGDTLSTIAAHHGTTWQAIARLNGLANPNLIHPGQVLRLR